MAYRICSGLSTYSCLTLERSRIRSFSVLEAGHLSSSDLLRMAWRTAGELWIFSLQQKPKEVGFNIGEGIALVKVSLALKRHHDRWNSYKGKHSIGDGLQFRGLIHCHHSRKHGGMQADMVLER